MLCKIHYWIFSRSEQPVAWSRPLQLTPSKKNRLILGASCVSGVLHTFDTVRPALCATSIHPVHVQIVPVQDVPGTVDSLVCIHMLGSSHVASLVTEQ
jgi:hypothetical protein